MNSLMSIFRKHPVFYPVFACLFWATNYVFGKIVVETLPPFHVSFIRWFIGSLIFLPFAYSEMKTHWRLLVQHWKLVLAMGATGVTGFNVLLYYGMQYTTSINAALINSFQTVIIVLLSVVFLKESISRSQYFGFAISLIGFLFLFFQGKWEKLITLTLNPGDLWVFLAIILWGIYSVLLKIAGPILPKTATFGTTIAIANIFLLVLMLIEEQHTPMPWHAFDLELALLILYLSIFPTVVAFSFWNESVTRLGVGKSSNFLHLVPIFATVIALLFGESLHLYHLVGGLLIISGIVLSSNTGLFRMRKKNQHVHDRAK